MMKKRLLFLFFLINVLFTSLARCAKRSNRKRSRKSSLRQIKTDVAELKDDHERMLVMMEEIGSGFGSSEEISEGYYLVDDMVLPCSDLDWDSFYEYEVPIPPSCKEELEEKWRELREKSKKKGRKGSKRKVKNKKGKKTKGKKIKGKKTKSKKERQKN